MKLPNTHVVASISAVTGKITPLGVHETKDGAEALANEFYATRVVSRDDIGFDSFRYIPESRVRELVEKHRRLAECGDRDADSARCRDMAQAAMRQAAQHRCVISALEKLLET